MVDYLIEVLWWSRFPPKLGDQLIFKNLLYLSKLPLLSLYTLLPRLAIVLILHGSWSQLCCFFGTLCSSFVQINMGTSFRDVLTPEGMTSQPSVARSNKLLARTVYRDSLSKDGIKEILYGG